MRTFGTLYGVSWERHHYGFMLYAVRDGFYTSRKYVGNGSDCLSVRECVRAFRRDVLNVGPR